MSTRGSAGLPDLALVLVVLVLASFGVFRMGPSDIPEHLMMGRLIWETKAPITTNLVSWTYPDHPNDQQYPLYQIGLYLMMSRLGWWSLSVFCCLTWTAAGLAWIRWAGTLRQCGDLSVVWLFAVLGIQRHLVARPEVFTFGGMALLLLAFEAWRRGQGRAPLVAMIVIQWLMVNTHQLFLLGWVLLWGFVAHLALTRLLAGRGWLDDADAALPIAPVAVTAALGVGIGVLSPNGPAVFRAPLSLLTTMTELGATAGGGFQSAELAPIWTDPIGLVATGVLTIAVGTAAWRSRGRWRLYELGVLLVGAAMVAAALRGIPFYAAAAAAVATRWSRRAPPLLPVTSPVRAVAAGVVVVLAGSLLLQNLRPRPHAYLARQYGVGKSIGEWGEHTTAFLRQTPPPGEMLNIGWVAANYLNFDVYPVRRVFVDGRWEAYPKPFLARTMAMMEDADVLQELIDEWRPGFVLAEMRMPSQQQRLAELVAGGRWRLVYVDSITAIAAAVEPSTAAYLEAHGLQPAQIQPPDWLPDHPVLHAQQQIRVARLLRYLGEEQAAASLLEAARALADDPFVAHDLTTVSP
ncbi:MAG TPA: hypothetical protein ENK18_16235 [Deltaproteobacteria bacterium]|nr:hypothetical protein [Deltaproteobacteria bacterium]